MNPHNGISDNNKKDRTKATAAAIPMVGAIVTAALLLSGLSLIGSFQQPVTAQEQNMTAGNATAGNVTAGNVTAGNVTAGNVTAGNVTAGNATNMTTGGGIEDILGGGGGGG
jgi:hypothetical protein